jgi:hypothetical protein
MRKVQPQAVKDYFAAFASETLEHFGRLEAALKGSAHEKRDLSILSERTLHSVYVSFERFLSDLILAYLNRDFSQFQTSKEASIKESVKAKHGDWIASRTSLSKAKHVSVDQIEAILDPDDYNVTFKDVAQLKDCCTKWLTPRYQGAIVGLNDADTHLIDTVHAIRDFIAHQSSASKNKMNDRLRTIVTGPQCPNLHLGRDANAIHDVGAFLKSSMPQGRRIRLYISRLSAIAASL